MVLIGTSKLSKHPKAATLYISIPADMAKDSQFKLKNGDKVQLTYNVEVEELTVKKEKET